MTRRKVDDGYDAAFADWADAQVRAALAKGAEKGKCGWHKVSPKTLERLVHNHWARKGQLIDVAVLILMMAWRKSHSVSHGDPDPGLLSYYWRGDI